MLLVNPSDQELQQSDYISHKYAIVASKCFDERDETGFITGPGFEKLYRVFLKLNWEPDLNYMKRCFLPYQNGSDVRQMIKLYSMEEVQYSRKEALQAIEDQDYDIERFPKNLLKEEGFMLEAVQIDGLFLQHGSQKIKRKKRICKKAVQQNGLAVQYIDIWSHNFSVVKDAIANDGRALFYLEVDKKIPQNPDLISGARNNYQKGLDFLKENPRQYHLFPKCFYKDLDFMSQAVEINGKILSQGTHDMKCDEDLTLKAIASCPEIYQDIVWGLQINEDFNLKALEVSKGKVFEFMSLRLKKKYEYIYPAVKHGYAEAIRHLSEDIEDFETKRQECYEANEHVVLHCECSKEVRLKYIKKYPGQWNKTRGWDNKGVFSSVALEAALKNDAIDDIVPDIHLMPIMASDNNLKDFYANPKAWITSMLQKDNTFSMMLEITNAEIQTQEPVLAL